MGGSIKNIKIETNSRTDLDTLRYDLQNNLTTKELADFAASLADNLTEESEFISILTKNIKKYEN